jgi:hypothetical protein
MKKDVSYLQGQKSKRGKRPLEPALADSAMAPAVGVVLGGEDEGREPEVGEDPVEGCKIAFVGSHGGHGQRDKEEDDIDGGLFASVSM